MTIYVDGIVDIYNRSIEDSSHIRTSFAYISARDMVFRWFTTLDASDIAFLSHLDQSEFKQLDQGYAYLELNIHEVYGNVGGSSAFQIAEIEFYDDYNNRISIEGYQSIEGSFNYIISFFGFLFKLCLMYDTEATDHPT